MITAKMTNRTSLLLWSGHTAEGYLNRLLTGTYEQGFPRRSVAIDFDVLDSDIPWITITDEDVPSWVDRTFGTLVHISGTDAEHRHLWDTLADGIEDGPQGADDDTFDYWPAAVDALEVYAKDMYSVTKDPHYMARLGLIAAKNADLQEFEDNAQRIITLTTPWKEDE